MTATETIRQALNVPHVLQEEDQIAALAALAELEARAAEAEGLRAVAEFVEDVDALVDERDAALAEKERLLNEAARGICSICSEARERMHNAETAQVVAEAERDALQGKLDDYMEIVGREVNALRAENQRLQRLYDKERSGAVRLRLEIEELAALVRRLREALERLLSLIPEGQVLTRSQRSEFVAVVVNAADYALAAVSERSDDTASPG